VSPPDVYIVLLLGHNGQNQPEPDMEETPASIVKLVTSLDWYLARSV